MNEFQPLNRRKLLATGSAMLALPGLGRAAPAEPTVLVELFTSQGCSSCPPADKLAGELARKPGIMVLTFNVDYWDYLGWRDTLAKPEYTQRQYDYARARGDGSVYTPQMIINGKADAVGSQADVVANLISTQETLPNAMTMTLTKKEILVEIAESAVKREGTLWLMAVKPKVTQKIARGENSGETITYHNVVYSMMPAAMWKGEAFKASWMRSAVMDEECKYCVAVLQQDKVGPVFAMAFQEAV